MKIKILKDTPFHTKGSVIELDDFMENYPHIGKRSHPTDKQAACINSYTGWFRAITSEKLIYGVDASYGFGLHVCSELEEVNELTDTQVIAIAVNQGLVWESIEDFLHDLNEDQLGNTESMYFRFI